MTTKKPFALLLLLALLSGQTGCKKGEKPEPQTLAAPTEAATQQPDLLKQRVARGTKEMVLRKKAYTVSYNRQQRTPNWVAWTLTREHCKGHLTREKERFEEDTDVPQPRATYQDYYDSHLDRGHMCPAGDNKWDQEALTESFLMTNICPQNHTLNKEDWNDLEGKCRDWARQYGEVTIVCGPLFEGKDEPRRIGRNKVAVPTGFFKVVYAPAGNGHASKAIAFIFTNNADNQPWRSKACSIDEVERRTGMDFFHQLPDDEEDRVEAMHSTATWK